MSNNAQNSKNNKIYNKPYLQIDKQIDRLHGKHSFEDTNTNRSLYVDFFNKNIYSQIRHYTHLFDEQPRKNYGRLNDIFLVDRKLSIILFSAIAEIETTLRAMLCNLLAEHRGVFWIYEVDIYRKKKLKVSRDNIDKILKNNDKKHKLESFRKKYADGKIPSWILINKLSFGELSKIFSNLDISSPFQNINTGLIKVSDSLSGHKRYPYYDFADVISKISDLRNIVAHHEPVIVPSLKIDMKSFSFARNQLDIEETSSKLMLVNGKVKLWIFIYWIDRILTNIRSDNSFMKDVYQIVNSSYDVSFTKSVIGLDICSQKYLESVQAR